MNALVVVVLICLHFFVTVAVPAAKPVAKPVSKPKAATHSPSRAPTGEHLPPNTNTFPLKPGQLFIDEANITYAILKNDRFPSTPGYLSVKRYSPIGSNLAVCDTTPIRFTTPVGGYFLGREYDFKVSGNNLYAYEWRYGSAVDQTIKYTFIKSTTLTCANFNNPVKSIPVSSGLNYNGYSGFFEVNNTFLYQYSMQTSDGYKKINLTTGSIVGAYYSPTSQDSSSFFMPAQYSKPIGSDGSNIYLTATYPQYGKNFTVQYPNGLIVQTDYVYPTINFGDMSPPLIAIISSKLYVWIKEKKLFTTYSSSGLKTETYTPILNIDVVATPIKALASSVDGKTMYLLACSSSFAVPNIRYLFSCDTSSPAKACQKSLIGPSDVIGPMPGIAESKPGVIVVFFAHYGLGKNFLNYYNIPV